MEKHYKNAYEKGNQRDPYPHTNKLTATVLLSVFDADGTVAAAINITTPESTLSGNDLETWIRDAVVETAATISEWLGHRGERRSA